MNGVSPAVCCIVTNDYAADAACLADHVAGTNPGVSVHALVIGDVPSLPASALPANLRWLPWTELLGARDRADYVARYSGFELCCAMRGLFHAHMHRQTPHDKWIMLDTDMAVLSSLAPVWAMLDAHELILTPHSTVPVAPELAVPHEVALLNHGLYNGGFLAMRRSVPSATASDWLASRLDTLGHHGPLKTNDRSLRHLRLFVDQLWLNLMPLYFQDVLLLRDEVYNLGHWNLFQGTLQEQDGSATFDGRPVVIAHFSGVDPACPEKVSRWTNLYEKHSSPAWARLFHTYERRRSHWRRVFGPSRYTFEKPVSGARRLARAARRWLRC